MLKLTMLCKLVATLFFLGYLPLAPGTVASAFAMTLLWILKPSSQVVLLTVILCFIFGVYASERIQRKTKRVDPPFIVIDEFVGSLVSVLFLPLTWKNLILGFILFRLLDILKPPPIRQIEKKVKGGFGIMLDDALAGVAANLLIRLIQLV